uniref:Pancreatic hormone n=1 Tax=Steinernema glaseri TaxID=37863 RepID=A0A1I7ZPD6_9BILA
MLFAVGGSVKLAWIIPLLLVLAVFYEKVSGAAAPRREKRQLSPAVKLQDDLTPILKLADMHPYWKRGYYAGETGSAPIDYAQHLSNMYMLENVGKRHAANGFPYGGPALNLKRTLSPSVDFLHQLQMSTFFDNAGK